MNLNKRGRDRPASLPRKARFMAAVEQAGYENEKSYERLLAEPRQRVRPESCSVEPRGIEPLSEDQKTRASPSAVCVLTFPPPGSRRQDPGFSSFIKSRRPQSLRRLVPCYYDVDGLRRRRLRVDDRRLSGESYVIVVVSSF